MRSRGSTNRSSSVNAHGASASRLSSSHVQRAGTSHSSNVHAQRASTSRLSNSLDEKTSAANISSVSQLERTEQLMKLSASNITHSTENSLRYSRSLTIENFIGIWLNLSTSMSNNDIYNYNSRLRSIINFFKTSIDLEECIVDLTKVKNEKVFLIVSGSIGPNFISRICDMTQLTAVYIFSWDGSEHERWFSQYKKVRGVFTQIEALSNELKADVCVLENALTSFSLIPPPTKNERNKLDSSFMYSQLLKEVLLEEQYDEQQKKKLVDFCRPHYTENSSESKIINEFVERYPDPSAGWWYTRECFLYKMLNKALRTQEVEMIIKMGFFVRHLHQQIKALYSQQNHSQPFIVYRGQGMFQPEFDKIINNIGGLLAFNSFLSTSVDRQVSLNFAQDALRTPDLIPVLFEIKMDLAQSTIPFASLDDISYFKRKEREILFSMHTVFRIKGARQIDSRLFQINLALTSDNDEQLTELTKNIQEVTRDQTRICRLGSLMIAMAEFDKAEEVYSTLLDTTSEHDREELASFYYQLGVINWEKRNLVNALSQFQQSLDIYLTCLPPSSPKLSSIYSNIGIVLQEQGDLNNSLKLLKRALNIDLDALQSNQLNIDPHMLQTHHINIATRYNNIGLVLDNLCQYNEALENYKRALEIELVHLPPIHPLLATTYNNIGMIHLKNGNHLDALIYYQNTFEIFERSLPANHPSLANTHHNIAHVLLDLDRTEEAIEHIAQAVDIDRHTLGSDHHRVKQYQQYLDELRQKSDDEKIIVENKT